MMFEVPEHAVRTPTQQSNTYSVWALLIIDNAYHANSREYMLHISPGCLASTGVLFLMLIDLQFTA